MSNQLQKLLNSCRLCGAETPDKIPILEEDEELYGDVAPLWKKIEECVGILVCKNDQMPKEICLQCIDKLNDFYEYRAVCAATNIQMRAILNSAPEDAARILMKNEPTEVTVLSGSEECVNEGAQACTTEDDTDTDTHDYFCDRLSTANNMEENPDTRSRRATSNDDRERIVRAYENGHMIKKIAEMFNFKRTTVGGIIQKYIKTGITHATVPRSLRKLTPEQAETVKQWRIADRTLSERKLASKISEVFGVKVTSTTVRRIIEPRKHYKKKTERKKKTEPTEVPMLSGSETCVNGGAQACTKEDDDAATKHFLGDRLSTAENVKEKPKARTHLVTSNGDRELIVRAFESGYMIKEIAEIFNFKRSTVGGIVQKYKRTGISHATERRIPCTKKLTPEQAESVKQWHTADRTLTYKKLASKVNEVFGVKVAPITICRVMKPRWHRKSKPKRAVRKKKTEPTEVPMLSRSEACVNGGAQACTTEGDDAATKPFLGDRLPTAENVEEKPKLCGHTKVDT
ncbi:uncharacterized protein LOC131263266 [Anopheles coustani]|uniref:uncharacterized protein LOC131263266 n=1 Tax=Anopheles coustani TaxID=139045 RepID=UPI002659F6BD|nr:uncharacterized protein LOC131263266 [Anopheles coustani]